MRPPLPWNTSTPSQTLLTDGSWGSFLLKKMKKKTHSPVELVNLTHPHWIRARALAFLEAGSEILLTNTFQASSLALQKTQNELQTKAINRNAVALLKEVVESHAYIFGSLGPLPLEMPTPSLQDLQKIQESAVEQAYLLQESGVDALILETRTQEQEAKAVVEALLNKIKIPIGLTFCPGFGSQGQNSPQGWNFYDFLHHFHSYPLAFWGLNCGNSPKDYFPLLPAFSAYQKPLWIKPSFHPSFPLKSWKKFLTPNIHFLGGCCATSPRLLQQLRKWRDSNLR
jgi:5-methyltetrahydrofolate--homocysteine methyltransferase